MHYQSLSCFMVLIMLLLINKASSSCSIDADCPFNSYCNGGVCSCINGYILDCTISAGYVGDNTVLGPFVVNTPSYFILQSEIDKDISYDIYLILSSNIIFPNYFNAQLMADQGISTLPILIGTNNQYPYNNVLNMQVSLRLGTMPDSSQPEKIILKITQTSAMPDPATTLIISYMFSPIQQNNMLSILGYVGGGILVLSAVFLIILLYRKKRRQNEDQQDNTEEKKQIDISHFQAVMPATTISIQAKRQIHVCSVCLQQFELNSIIRKTICDHIFHKQCIDQWCLKNLNCPMCRTELSHVNILRLRVEGIKKDNDTSWVMNTIDLEEEGSEIRQPLQPQVNEQPIYEVGSNIGNAQL